MPSFREHENKLLRSHGRHPEIMKDCQSDFLSSTVCERFETKKCSILKFTHLAVLDFHDIEKLLREIRVLKLDFPGKLFSSVY